MSITPKTRKSGTRKHFVLNQILQVPNLPLEGGKIWNKKTFFIFDLILQVSNLPLEGGLYGKLYIEFPFGGHEW